MSLRILPTKLNPPTVRTTLVERPALQNRLAQGLRGKVTIVSAPPGFGKSTLLAAWIAAEPEKRVAFDSYARTYRPPQQPLFFPYRLQTLLQIRYLARQKVWDESRRLVQEQVRLAYEAGYLEYERELGLMN